MPVQTIEREKRQLKRAAKRSRLFRRNSFLRRRTTGVLRGHDRPVGHVACLDSSPQNLRIGLADSSFGNAVCRTDKLSAISLMRCEVVGRERVAMSLVYAATRSTSFWMAASAL
jgi:hypothetical protein